MIKKKKGRKLATLAEMATPLQRQTAKILLENPTMPVGKAMIQAGYSPNTAINPNFVTRSEKFQALMESQLPDRKIIKAHKEALEANKVISATVFPDGKDGTPVNDFIEVPDHQIRLRAAELGYKVKGNIVGSTENSLHFHQHIEQKRQEYVED